MNLPPRRKGDGWNPDDFSVPAPPPARARDPMTMEMQAEPEEPLDIQFREPEEKKATVWRGVLALLVAAILTIPAVFYMTAVRATPAVAEGVSAEAPEAPAPADTNSRSVSPVAPSRSSGGGGGSRSTESFYREAGNITDIFCRPREAETPDAWRRRVPLNCIDNYRPPGR